MGEADRAVEDEPATAPSTPASPSLEEESGALRAPDVESSVLLDAVGKGRQDAHRRDLAMGVLLSRDDKRFHAAARPGASRGARPRASASPSRTLERARDAEQIAHHLPREREREHRTSQGGVSV